jgi:aminopeptidase N
VRFGLVGPNGDDLAIESAEGAAIDGDVIQLTDASHTIVFEGISAPPIPSLLRGFSAPVRLSIDLSPEDLLFLLRTDSDPFNRWQAAQMLAIHDLIERTGAAIRGQAVVANPAFIDALGEAAEDGSLEPAFRAQVLLLPGEADIAREIGRDVDPDAIATARNALRSAIADRIGRRLAGIVDGLATGGPFSTSAEAAGRRTLANTALDLMVANGDRTAIDRVVGRFNTADNMTDRVGALSILTHSVLDERFAALETFYERYRDDALVLDKWLTLEATVPAAETLDRVRALLDHPAFSMSNPNRIRALIGGFASGNQTQFNRADGAGYAFLADFVTDLDRRNPQTAARLLVSFRSWRALEPGRRAHAEKMLRDIAAIENLSSDLRDIVARMLA